MGIAHENRGPERDQRICPQARKTLAPLPLEANRRAEAGGDEEIQSGLREPHGHHGEDLHELKSHEFRERTVRARPCPNSAILLASTQWKEGRCLRTPAILANRPRRLTDQPCPIASMTTRNSTSATATTR